MMVIALLLLAIPVTASAQVIYQRNYDRYDRYDRVDRRDVRAAINQLANSSVQLERDLNAGRQRPILGGLLWVNRGDSPAVAEVREFRRAVAELRLQMRGDVYLDSSRDEARDVLERGVRLDRYLRLRTGNTNVDADLASIRSSLHVIAEAYGLNVRY